jgi:uncharacterized membrane protein YoaK (UPF0700 family)
MALTFAAGAVDAVVFLRLDVFTAVMTGNIVFLGIAIGQGAIRNALRSLVALAAYACGVIVGARIVGVVPREVAWSARVTRALAIEWLLQAAFLGGWLLTDSRPDGPAAAALIGFSGLAMGLQAATARGLVPGMSTTYLTGTLTALLTELSALSAAGVDWSRRAVTVVALGTGAVASAAVLLLAPAVAPAIPVAVVGVVVLIAATRFH